MRDSWHFTLSDSLSSAAWTRVPRQDMESGIVSAMGSGDRRKFAVDLSSTLLAPFKGYQPEFSWHNTKLPHLSRKKAGSSQLATSIESWELFRRDCKKHRHIIITLSTEWTTIHRYQWQTTAAPVQKFPPYGAYKALRRFSSDRYK
ncbi:unnamed protein product [Cercospora beticola]|nr:unnamed protein product [Cercospora beticola]